MTIISDDPAIQARYEELLGKGNAPRLAEMLAFRKAPGTIDDTQLLRGVKNYDSTDPYLIAKLKKAGVPERGIYDPSMARFPGDPRAVVTSRDDVRRHCERTGAGCEKLGIKMRHVEPEMVDLAPDLVAKEVALDAAVDPAKVATKKRMQRTVDDVKTRLKGNSA